MSLKKILKITLMKKAQVPLEIPEKLSLKHKFLTGQASLEYFILFVVITLLTLLSLSSFFSKVQASGDGLFKNAVGRIIK